MKRVSIVLSLLTMIVGTVSPAEAAFPGSNGLLAFQAPGGIGVARPGRPWALVGPGAYPSWSPDGSRIASIGSTSRVCVMDADGTHRRCVGSRGNGTAWPAWAPDGSTIVFARSSDLWSIDVDAATPTALNLTRTPNIVENYPAWSPDGSLIAYDRHVSGHRVRIYAMAPDGTGRHPLTDGTLTSHDPDWSPDGTHIVFQLYLDPATNVLAVMNADGSDQHVILHRSVADAVYSPDGHRIAFTLLTPPDLIPTIGRIWSDGSHFTRIIFDPAGEALFFPSWQPVV